MNERLNWMFPSTYVGRLFRTDIRMSWWFVVALLIILPKYGIAIGLAFTTLLYVSVLLHEFAHVFAARWTGGYADEIHLTPMGGLAMVRPSGGASGLAITAGAGPAVNLMICLVSYPGWYAPETLWESLNPFVLPISELRQERIWRDLALLLFCANWIGLLVNLLPVLPLDGGQILRAILSARIHPEYVQRTAIRVGMVVAVVILIVGAIFNLSQVVLIGTFVLTMNLVQMIQEEIGEAQDESGLGYDFSAGYESLERSQSATSRDHKGLFEQWRQRRRLKREEQERVKRQAAEEQLDILLAKVHEHGMSSLSDQEKKLLESCSKLLRPRAKGDE